MTESYNPTHSDSSQNSEFSLRIHTSQTQIPILAEFTELLTKQNKKRFRIYSQNSFFHKHKPNICRICRIHHKIKKGSEFAELRIHTSQTNPTFAEFAELLTKNKRGSEFCRTQQKFSEFNSSQTKPKFTELLRKKKVRNLHNSEFILRINSSETNPKSAEFAEVFFVCVVVRASPVPPILLLLLLLVVVVGRGASKYLQSLIPRKSGEKEKTDTLIMQNGGLHPLLCQ
jgi:hypothetical protein